MSPLLVSLAILIPFFLVHVGMIKITRAYYAAFIIVSLILFLLGAMAGKIARDSVVKQGIVMLLAGAVIAAVFIAMNFAGLLQ
jgi:VIT1/CCC1 family predicted Fe2+/Mn2+ transporter